MAYRLRCTIAAALLAGSPAFALVADEEKAGERSAFSLLVENDFFIQKTDRDYTNGIALTWTTPPSNNPDKLFDIARAMHLLPKNGDVRASFEIGQNIYTPEHIELYDPPPTERPYAGFLYGAVGLVSRLEPTELERALRLLGEVPDDTILRLVALLDGLPDNDVLGLVEALSRLSPTSARRATTLMSGVVKTLVR